VADLMSNGLIDEMEIFNSTKAFELFGLNGIHYCA
jgi:hypothetical protein